MKKMMIPQSSHFQFLGFEERDQLNLSFLHFLTVKLTVLAVRQLLAHSFTSTIDLYT